MRTIILAIAATSFATSVGSAFAQQEHHGNQLQTHRSISEITTPSVDGFWRVHEIGNLGSAHFRVTDVTGRAQLVFGLVDGRIWAVPGCDADTRISLPNARLSIPDDATVSIVHIGEQFQVLHFGHPSGSIWSVESL